MGEDCFEFWVLLVYFLYVEGNFYFYDLVSCILFLGDFGVLLGVSFNFE